MPKTIGSKIVIRNLGPDDLEPFHRLRSAALEESPHSFGSDLSTWKAATLEQVRGMLEESASPSDSSIIGAFTDAGLTGMVGLRRESKGNVRHKATLWGFFVLPAARGQGAGMALVADAMRQARELQGMHHVRLIVTSKDEAAQRIFKRAGFEQYGLELAGLKSGGVFHDQIYMSTLSVTQ